METIRLDRNTFCHRINSTKIFVLAINYLYLNIINVYVHLPTILYAEELHPIFLCETLHNDPSGDFLSLSENIKNVKIVTVYNNTENNSSV